MDQFDDPRLKHIWKMQREPTSCNIPGLPANTRCDAEASATQPNSQHDGHVLSLPVNYQVNLSAERLQVIQACCMLVKYVREAIHTMSACNWSGLLFDNSLAMWLLVLMCLRRLSLA